MWIFRQLCVSTMFVVLGSWSAVGVASPEDLAVTDMQLESSARVGRSTKQYVYTITVNNPAEPLDNVVATVTSNNGATQIVEGEVVLGAVATGTINSTDTFTFRHNRRYTFNPASLVWTFSGDAVEPTNTAPTADAGPDQSTNVGQAVQLDGTGSSDPEEDLLTYLWDLSVPSGSTSALSNTTNPTPTFVPDVAGTYTATLVTNDGDLNSAPDAVVIEAAFVGDNPPAITSNPATQAELNVAYTYSALATDPDQGDTLTWSLMAAPAGMTINSTTGLISWTPDATGPADVDVVVTDSTGLTDRQIYLVRVNNGEGDQPPILAPITDESIVAGQALMTSASATDPEGEAIRYALISPPAGVSIHSVTGQIVWTPAANQVGTASVTVSASDPGGLSDQTSFSVSVLSEQVNNAPVVDPIADQTVNALATIQLTINATDPDEGDILSLSLSGAPAGMQFDAQTGQINWSPGASDVGVVNLEASATDSAGDFDIEAFSITVVETPKPPVAVNDAYTVRHSGTLDIPAPGVLENDTDANNDALTSSNTTSPTLGTLTAFDSDGSFQYQPPPIPPITLGLSEQCSVPDVFGDNDSVVVADVDADGDLEMLVMNQSTFESGVWIFDGATCALEGTMTPAPEFGEMLGSLAAVNLDADPELELVVPYWRFSTFIPAGGSTHRLMAFNLDGSPVWGTSGLSEGVVGLPESQVRWYERGASVVDLDGDGLVELVVASNGRVGNVSTVNRNVIVIFNGEDGTIFREYEGIVQGGHPRNPMPRFADLDLDGTLEIIFGHSVLSHEGELEFLLPETPGFVVADGMRVVVANFDNDPYPEILGVERRNQRMYEHDGTLKWTRPLFDGTTNNGVNGGGITVAELDGDPLPEYLFYPEIIGSDEGLTAFDTDGTQLWTHADTDFGGGSGYQSTTPTAFDFDRDGIDEIVIQLNRTSNGFGGTFIFDGTTGANLAEARGDANHVGGSQVLTIADVDADGAAEIISIWDGAGFVDRLIVFEGLPGNPYPPARGIRNQWAYVPTQVNDDGSIPPYFEPQWLIPGLNKVNAMPVIPGQHPSTMDAFNYVANDGTVDSNEATVDITIATVNAPMIVSSPPLGGSPGFVYEYGVLATDADFGDLFTWTLVDAPAGMTISSNGIVAWLPQVGDLGTHSIHVVVTDAQGNADNQAYELTVIPPVTVPDLVETPEGDAQGAIEGSGLAVGSVTQAFSLTIPAGQIISQSLDANSSSAAGAFVNYVVSLGPPPIYAPQVTGLTLASAEAALNDLTLELGAVTYTNTIDTPLGAVLSQSVAPNTQVLPEAVVDLVISGGPALTLSLSTQLVGASSTIDVAVEAFNATGAPAALPGDLVFNVVPDAAAVGTVPSVVGGQVLTDSDTAGPYTIEVSSASLGVSLTEPIVVSAQFDADGAQVSYAAFSATLAEVNGIFSDLAAALAAGDVVTVQALAVQLEQARANIDLDDLRLTPATAPSQGFLPDSAPDFPVSADATFSNALRGVTNAINDSQVFFARLDDATARNDDIRMIYLSDNLRRSVDTLLAATMTRRASVVYAAQLHDALSVVLPHMVASNVDAALDALRDAGLLAQAGSIDAVYIASREFNDAAERQTFFTLGSMMSAQSIQMTIVKDFYLPIVTDIFKNMQNLVIEGLVKATLDVADIPGIVTGASLSYHSFTLGHSIIEAPTQSTQGSQMIILAVGPTVLSQLAEALAGVQGVQFDNLRNTVRSIQQVKDAGEAANQAIQDGFAQFSADGILSGCVFDNAPGCQQLGISGGIPSVHKSGSFPAPVLLITYDPVSGQIALGNFLFFPKP